MEKKIVIVALSLAMFVLVIDTTIMNVSMGAGDFRKLRHNSLDLPATRNSCA